MATVEGGVATFRVTSANAAVNDNNWHHLIY
jgi:hypothetical protein